MASDAALAILRGHALELSLFSVFADLIMLKIFSVHGDVDTTRKSLHKSQRAPKIEEPVGASKLVWDHSAREDDRLSFDHTGNYARGLDHRIRAVRDEYPVLLGLETRTRNAFSILKGHV